MLIKLPGGHFVDPQTVAAVVTEEDGPGRNHVQCLLTTGVVCESPPVGTPRTARRMMRETVAAINAALSPESVEPVRTVEALSEDLRAVALDALQDALGWLRGQFEINALYEHSQTSSAINKSIATVKSAITRLESNQPEA